MFANLRVTASFLPLLLLPAGVSAGPPGPALPSTTPQPYTVQRNDSAGALTLQTPYYTIEHDLKRGGVISRIQLTRGKAPNLLINPLETRLRDAQGGILTDVRDPKPNVQVRHSGLNGIVTVDSVLTDPQGHSSAVRLRTTFEYRWGYIKIHKEFLVPKSGLRVLELCPVTMLLAPSLTHYGYREGKTEEEGAPPFSFGSNQWGKLGDALFPDQPLDLRYLPRSMIFVDPDVEGLEWFAASDLSQWDLQLTGRRGDGQATLQRSRDPAGLALALAPFSTTNTPLLLTNSCVFDFYIGFPILEGHAHRPWVHTSFNRNKGNWVTTEQIQRWAAEGMQTVHCHNDGDYYDDGLFWRDGSYPPYPDMDRYDRVLQDCRKEGIRTATYFSNKELHPSTEAFKEHGIEWGRMNRKGDLQHNFFRGKSEFGAQMCLHSGWLGFLKSSIDRVLKNHPLDGVYYDWNVALFCCNPRHEGIKGTNTPAKGHWDIDELLDLMEWTRRRVGPHGLIIVHNTTTPMFATENFADYVVATEWGYDKWTDRAPDPKDLPLEWTLAGARPRGVISYGTIDSKAPRVLHRLFALEAFLGNVTPWPASPETFEMLPRLKPLGDIESYRFADWRNQAITLSDPRCASAAYSRPGEAWALLANLDSNPREVTCHLDPTKLPYPIARLSSATRLEPNSGATDLDIRQLVGEGLKLTLPGADATFIRLGARP